MQRILVILDDSHPADALRMNFCLAAIRASHPDAEVVLLLAARALPILERSALCDRIVVSRLYELRSASLLLLRFRKLWELARLVGRVGRGFDLAITLGWGSTLLNVLGWLAARRNVGYTNRWPSLHSSRLKRWDRHKDWDQQNVELLRAAGIQNTRLADRTIIYTRDDDHAVDRMLVEQGVEPASDLVILHPGSDWACQQWLQDRWAALADRLIEDYGATVAFTGMESEGSYIEAIQQRMRLPCVSLAGKTTLAQLQAVLSRARLCICVDSAAYDLALNEGVPVVVLAGPTNSSRSLPTPSAPIVINRMAPELKHDIQVCKEPKYVNGGCLNYDCPMAGLRDIQLADALVAIEASGAMSMARTKKFSHLGDRA